MKNFTVYASTKLGLLRAKALSLKKDLGGKELIVEVGLAVIAVGLIIIFQDDIGGLMATLVEKSQTEIDKLFTVTTP